MCRFKLILAALVLVTGSVANAQIISGSATVELNGPATQEQTLKAQELSRKTMKKELVEWFESINIDFDTLNPVKNYMFESFIDSCMIHAEKNP
ncbi:MAG: hypothetical protein Q4F84_05935 [Fibrobacter sp.]|nr:hypothetical protein [Fibrobacter sp.]